MFEKYLRKKADIPNASVQREHMNPTWTLKVNWRIMENLF